MSAEPSAISDALEAGQVVGEYRVEAKIGEGGFGAVYSARHPVIGKQAAIKVLSVAHSKKSDHVSRFIAEAKAVNQVGHPNIVDIFAFGQLPDGRHYFVMELIDGVTLRELIDRDGALPLDEALPILRAIAKALGAAHEKGILHRDLKPDNVLVVEDDGERDAKLIDFGIAKLLDEDVDHKTRTGTPLGTPYYMSPEQCRSRDLDARTDVYSLGVLTFFALTGRRPFEGESSMDVMLKHMTEPPPSIRDVVSTLPAELDAAIASMLGKEPDERPASAREALELLENAAFEQLVGPASTAARTMGNATRSIATAAQQPSEPKRGLSAAHWGAFAFLATVGLGVIAIPRLAESGESTVATPERTRDADVRGPGPRVRPTPHVPTSPAISAAPTPTGLPSAIAPRPPTTQSSARPPTPGPASQPQPAPPPPPRPKGGSRDDLAF